MPKSTPPDLEALRREIAAERERIADTVAALAYRANVPARVREDVSDRLAAARRSAFGRPAVETPAAQDALQPGDAGDDAAMLAVESAVDVLEAIDVRTNGLPGSTARFVARYRLLFAIGAFAAFALLAISVAVKRGKPDGRDAAA